MKNTSPLQFTEHHRFYVFRDFCFSPLDQRVLWDLYQPMVGHGAMAFYQTLYRQIEEERFGYSAAEQQRSLFYAMGLELGEQGRRTMIGYTSMLEACGLLRTSRRFMPRQDEYVYVYQLEQPLHPRDFFAHSQLPLLLRDCLGKHAYEFMLRKWVLGVPAELCDPTATEETLTISFQERFTLQRAGGLNGTTEPLRIPAEDVPRPVFGKAPVSAVTQSPYSNAFSYMDILMRTPKSSSRHKYIKKLEKQPDVMAQINYIAHKHSMGLTDLCRMLDEEDGVFDDKGGFHYDLLDRAAQAESARQAKRDEWLAKASAEQMGIEVIGSPDETLIDWQALTSAVPLPVHLNGRMTGLEYVRQLRLLPYTQFIALFLDGQPLPERIKSLLDRSNYYYGIADASMNAFIHFMYTNALTWNEKYVESLLNEWSMSRMTAFEDSLLFFERKTKTLLATAERQAAAKNAAGRKPSGSSAGSAATGTSSTGYSRTAQMRPKVGMQDGGAGQSGDEAGLSQERLEEIRRKAQEYEVQTGKRGGGQDGVHS